MNGRHIKVGTWERGVSHLTMQMISEMVLICKFKITNPTFLWEEFYLHPTTGDIYMRQALSPRDIEWARLKIRK